MLFLSSADFFQINFFEKIFQEYHQRAKISSDTDQARHFVGPDRLQSLSADDTSRQGVKRCT